jgi:hypothetical protein
LKIRNKRKRKEKSFGILKTKKNEEITGKHKKYLKQTNFF